MGRYIIKILISYFLLVNPVYSEKIQAFDFTIDEYESLEVKKVKKLTTYKLGSN